MIEKDESPILSIYLKDLAEAAYKTFSTKYALHAAAADPDRGVSQPRRLLGAHGRTGRTRRAGRELRDDARVRFAGGEGRRSVQLGLDGVARAGAHVHARQRPTIAFRGGCPRVCRSTRSTRAAGLGLQRHAGFPRRVQGEQARPGEPDERRLHASGVSASRCSSRTTRRRSCAS